MNDLDLRRQILSRASALTQPAGLADAELLRLLGQSYRLACTDEGDSDEAAQVVADADRLLDQARASLAGRTPVAASPDLALVEDWLADPHGPASAVLDVIDALGAQQAGLEALGAEATLAPVVAQLADRIRLAGARHPGALVELARLAAERSVVQGVVPGADDAMLALDDVLHRHLTSALRRTSQAPRRLGLRPLDTARAEQLGQTLAAALQRKSPLTVSPELLDLAAFFTTGGPRSVGRDVMLHGASSGQSADESLELMRNVTVRVTADEIEVELQGDESGPVLLIPLVDGEPRLPSPSRAGSHARHLVFSPSDEPGLDGYALIVGERLAFLKR